MFYRNPHSCGDNRKYLSIQIEATWEATLIKMSCWLLSFWWFPETPKPYQVSEKRDVNFWVRNRGHWHPPTVIPIWIAKNLQLRFPHGPNLQVLFPSTSVLESRRVTWDQWSKISGSKAVRSELGSMVGSLRVCDIRASCPHVWSGTLESGWVSGTAVHGREGQANTDFELNIEGIWTHVWEIALRLFLVVFHYIKCHFDFRLLVLSTDWWILMRRKLLLLR